MPKDRRAAQGACSFVQTSDRQAEIRHNPQHILKPFQQLVPRNLSTAGGFFLNDSPPGRSLNLTRGVATPGAGRGGLPGLERGGDRLHRTRARDESPGTLAETAGVLGPPKGRQRTKPSRSPVGAGGNLVVRAGWGDGVQALIPLRRRPQGPKQTERGLFRKVGVQGRRQAMQGPRLRIWRLLPVQAPLRRKRGRPPVGKRPRASDMHRVFCICAAVIATPMLRCNKTERCLRKCRSRHGKRRITSCCFSAHGAARSIWPHSRIRVASAPNRAAKCIPTGSLSDDQCKGSDTAGWPEAL